MMHILELQPIDTLFLRDARPMRAGAGSGGHGANWPLPTVVHEALRSALLRLAGPLPSGKRESSVRRTFSVAKERRFATRAFESLRTLGPLPVQGDTLFVPAPVDLIPDGEGQAVVLSPIMSAQGQSNLPASWLKPVATTVRLGKRNRWEWIPTAYLQVYLSNTGRLNGPDKAVLFNSERRIGIALDPSTRAAAEGKLYAAEHLRLHEDVRLWVAASLSERDASLDDHAGVSLAQLGGACLTLGGESRMCRVHSGEKNLLDFTPRVAGLRIKWVLATPAVFNGGWLPNWISESDGAVLLRDGDAERQPGEDRKTWRKRVQALPPIRARLEAVCISRPLVFSGWDLGLESIDEDGKIHLGGPKPTMLAAQGGTVYYFQADNDAAAAALVTALHGRTRSDFFGEKGMGLGFCGSWEPLR